MSAMIVITLVLFAVVYFFDLKNKIISSTQSVTTSAPFFNDHIYGEFDNALDRPLDITVVDENVYVSDTNNKRIQVFSKTGEFKFTFGKQGGGQGEFMFPYGLTSDKAKNVYVADLYNKKISIFDKTGKFIKYFKETDANPVLDGMGGIRIVNEKLYVTDINKGKVFIYGLDGKKILEISEAGGMKLYAPNATAVDKSGNIYISDSGNNRVVAFDKKGKYIRTINGSKDGKGASTFINPRGLGISDNEVLFIVDNMSHNIHAYDLKGKELYTFGAYGTENENFILPNGLFIDSTGRIYITDPGNARVAMYN